jgi:small ligand-binding sensory domain FIST
VTRRFGSGLAVGEDVRGLVTRAAEAAAEQLDGASADLVAVFGSPEVMADAGGVLDEIGRRLTPGRLIGASTEAVVGGGREIEGVPAVAVWAARLPGAALTPFTASVGVGGAPEDLGWPADHDGSPTVLLADPFTFDTDALLSGLSERVPAPVVVGGLASGGARPGEHTLLLDDRVVPEGAVAMGIGGAGLLPLVSQGCAPIGPEMVVTGADDGRVEALASKAATAKLEEIIAELGERERRLAANGLLAGLVIDENQPDYERGDFLVRGIHGVDPGTGAIVVGERVRVGQTLRFHVRDAASADDDLRQALAGIRGMVPEVGGALVFTCNGRGVGMFGTPDHDAAVIHGDLGGPALAGMFANGEIGPVGGRNFLHGFTATMALFPA